MNIMLKYFIADCNGTIVGNQKGYATFNGANRAQDRKNSKVYRQIWDAFYAKEQMDSNSRLICRVFTDVAK
jgi:hypothetical protein